MTRFFLLLLPLFLLVETLSAQGDWSPPEAIFTRPRLLLGPGDIARLHVRLGEAPFSDLYRSIWEEAVGALPPDDTLSDRGRRENAQLAKNLAFILIANRRPEGSTMVELSGEERDSIMARIGSAFERINIDVDPLDEETWDDRGMELIDYLATLDLTLGAGVGEHALSQVRQALALFTGNLHYAAVSQKSGPIPLLTMHDHRGLVICGALGIGAIVLNETTGETPDLQASNWMNSALWWSDSHLWVSEERLSDRDRMVGYAEGPGHMRRAFLSLLPFHRALGRVLPVDSIEVAAFDPSRTIPHPWFDSGFDTLFAWVSAIHNPDGTLPSIEQTHVNVGFQELALTGESHYGRPIISRFTDLERSLMEGGVDMRANYIAAGTELQVDASTPLNIFIPDAGNALLLSTRQADAWGIGLLAEHGRARSAGGGYDQGDAGSYYIVSGDQPLSYDPGYLREEFAEGEHHNLILIDGAAPGSGSDVDASIDRFWSFEPDINVEGTMTIPLGYAQVSTSYGGARITRHVMMIDGAYGVIADDVSADEPHEYTWQLHGYMPVGLIDTISGGFELNEDDREAEWRNGDEGLATHVIATGGDATFGTVVDEHELNSGTTGPHNPLHVTTPEPTRSVQFVAGIAPRPISGDLMFDSNPALASATLVSRAAGPHDVFSLAGDTLRRTISGVESYLPYDIVTDARFIGGDLSPFGDVPRFLFMIDGTELTVDDMPAITATPRMDVALFNNFNLYREGYDHGAGYVSDSGHIFLRMDWLNQGTHVYGPTVRTYTILWATGRVGIEFSGPGYFAWGPESGVEDEGNARDRADAAHITDATYTDGTLDVTVETAGRIDGRLRVHGIDGKVIDSRSLSEETGVIRVKFDLSGVPSGTFLVALEDGGEVVAVRVVGGVR